VSASRPLRAPRENGAIVAEPPLEEVGYLLAANKRKLASSAFTLFGRSILALRQHARAELLSAARTYLSQAGEPLPDTDAPSIVMAGHQPELSHPGVWVKHFALNGLARKHRAVPVNLIVDNDRVKSSALSVPVYRDPPPPIDAFQPRAVDVPFDRWTAAVPYEERTVLDEALFASFAERVPRGWGFVPLLHEFWQEVCRQRGRTNLLGERFAAARRTWERRWGCHNFEVPVSRVCQTEAFAWFACHLLAELPRFHAIYNDCVRAHRRAHGIRSRNHPVPDLAAEGDWLEAPFWAWHAGQARRSRLFARNAGPAIELRISGEPWPALPLRSTADMILGWQALQRRDLKVRSRALTNTLYARLFLSDLFFHGIGGGKYDELTDDIMRRFYGIEPPGYLVMSATLLLPFTTYPASQDQCRQLAWEARDLLWNPQRHLNEGQLSEARLRQAVVDKQALIERQPVDRRERRERFRMLRELTEQLRPSVGERELDRIRSMTRCEEQVRANAILQRRDYAFCFYPEQLLRPFCTQFL
jgi:hypothetical protein